MRKSLIVIALALLAGLAVLGRCVFERHAGPATAPSPAASPSPAEEEKEASEAQPGFIYGRITADLGAVYEGRLRWGKDGGQEAFWGDYFNGFKVQNPWAAHVPTARLPRKRDPIQFLGFEIARRERPANLGRPFMRRFGDIARIEARGAEVRVILKSGAAFVLDRFEASDFDDGVRVWDARRGAVDLDNLRIRTIELLPTARPGDATGRVPGRLHGTVRTRQGDFTGFVQWDREEGVGSDQLDGRTAEGELGLRFDTLRSIARRSLDGSLVTLRDGRTIELSGTQDVGDGNRGIYVDDSRYGRVLVSWDAFQRVDFSTTDAGGTGPAYGDFPPGRPLTGSVTTRAGRRLAGRLVYDLDESETTETLDAPSRGVDYTLPFGLIASLVLPGGEEGGARRARVTLHSGEVLQLEPTGDLGERNAGLLVFIAGRKRPVYVPWTDVARVDFDRPPAMYPPLGG